MHAINLSAGWTFDGGAVGDGGSAGRRAPTGHGCLLTADFPAEAWLNGAAVGDEWPIDVTGKLQPRNELVLACGAVGAVALEIHSGLTQKAI